VIQDCLSGRPEYFEVDLSERVAALLADGSLAGGDGLLQNGRLRTLPGIQPCDGFFAAMISRR